MKILEVYKETTEKERQRMIAGGMIQISKEELDARLEELGYYVKKDDNFNYLNTGNEITYLAKAVYIADKVSKKSFANTETKNENLPALQALRFSHFCFESGRIWEL